ncbi:hypothetical protein ACLOJK_014919 [Asimina triloba]
MTPKKGDRCKAPMVEEEIERPRTRSRAAVTVTCMSVEPERAGISFNMPEGHREESVHPEVQTGPSVPVVETDTDRLATIAAEVPGQDRAGTSMGTQADVPEERENIAMIMRMMMGMMHEMRDFMQTQGQTRIPQSLREQPTQFQGIPVHDFRCTAGAPIWCSITLTKAGSHGCRWRSPAGCPVGRSKPPKMSRATR